ncbi:MAG: redoxin domain-containing protein [Gemmatimonadetes bacterium]|nr:redoxin domain-containing protein [Gemmatimonadota bacterium]
MRRWEELRPEFDAAGVQVVTVCTDTPGEIRAGRGMHGLQATMLADPKLSVIEQFGYRNQNLNNFKPLPNRPGLPVPTSLLVDESGQVVWKDQAETYQKRSDPDVVSAALSEHFPA